MWNAETKGNANISSIQPHQHKLTALKRDEGVLFGEMRATARSESSVFPCVSLSRVREPESGLELSSSSGFVSSKSVSSILTGWHGHVNILQNRSVSERDASLHVSSLSRLVAILARQGDEVGFQLRRFPGSRRLTRCLLFCHLRNSDTATFLLRLWTRAFSSQKS